MKFDTEGFQPQRLLQLRTNAMLTQTQLAELIPCSKSNISKWEKGGSIPEASNLNRLSEIFSVQVSWFFESPIFSSTSQPSFFRAQNRTPKAARDIARIRLDWAEEISYKLQESLEFPNINLPSVSGNVTTLEDYDIEQLALECRKLWNLGLYTIPDLINSMESNGVIVTQGELNFLKMDGVSRWSEVDGHPYVFLCLDKANGFRSRFDAAHELGHIIMHRHLSESEYQQHYHLLEQQAHRFASAFLLPAPSFTRDIRYPTLENFLALKSKWKVSVAAMIHRTIDLELINEQTALRLWKARSARGWVKKEPLDDELIIEKPKLLQRSIFMLVENKILDKESIKNILGVPEAVTEELCNLPTGYFQTEHRNNVIDIRLRPKSTNYNKPKNSTAQIIPMRKIN